jgi:tocopherol O-methyltransferase
LLGQCFGFRGFVNWLARKVDFPMAGKSGTDCVDCKLTGRTISATSLTQVTKGAENYCEPDVASHYDSLDDMYRRIWGEGLHHGLWVDDVKTTSEAADRMTQFVGDRLELRAKERVLDVGCGYGRMMADLAERFGVEAMGVTISRRQWEQAVPGGEIRLGDWLQNDLPAGEFDAVMAIESLEHMPNPQRAVSEMVRVVKPGGRMVLGCWMSCDRPRDWERRYLIEPIRRDGMLMGMADEREVRRWLREAGAELLEVHDLSRDVERTWPDCLRRVLWMTIRDGEMRRLLSSDWRRNLRMGFTLNKIWAAYVVGAMRYVVFTARRPL